MTASCNTYVSPSVDISFKYPDPAKVDETATNNNTIIEIFDPADPDNSEITMQQASSYSTLSDVLTKFYNNGIEGKWYAINGFTVFSTDNTNETFIANKREIISIKAQNNSDTYTQLINSFTFISQTVNWKKYQQNGLMFYYPQNWYIQNTSKIKPLPHGYANDMTVIANPTQFVHYTSLDKCSEETDSSKICLGGNNDTVENISINGNSAQNFYLNGQGDFDEHVVQIEGKNGQKVELQTSVFID